MRTRSFCHLQCRSDSGSVVNLSWCFFDLTNRNRIFSTLAVITHQSGCQKKPACSNWLPTRTMKVLQANHTLNKKVFLMIAPRIPKGTSQHCGLMTYKFVWLVHIFSITIFFSTASDGTLSEILLSSATALSWIPFHLFSLIEKRIKQKLSFKNHADLPNSLCCPFSRYFYKSYWIHTCVTPNLCWCNFSNISQITQLENWRDAVVNQIHCFTDLQAQCNTTDDITSRLRTILHFYP